MRGSTRLLKRLIALFLVVLMSINTLAAIVGDNDGAAFITKAEFDSMKNNFQSQLDRYNSSIDNKIDGAIAGYLAGVTVGKQSVLSSLINTAKSKNVNNVSFAKKKDWLATKDAIDAQAGLYWTMIFSAGNLGYTGGNGKPLLHGGFIIGNGAAWAGAIDWFRYTNWTGSASNYDSCYYVVNFPFGEGNTDLHKTQGDTEKWTLSNINRQRCNFTLSSQTNTFGWTTNWFDEAVDPASEFPSEPEILNDFSIESLATSYQPGTTNAASVVVVYGTEKRPQLSIGHRWTLYNDNNNINAKRLNYMISGSLSGQAKCIDFAFRDNYVPDNAADVEIAYSRPQNIGKSGDGGKSGSQGNIYYYDDQDGDGTFDYHLICTEHWGRPNGFRNDLHFRWKWNRQKIYTLNWNKLTAAYWNGIFSAPYYKYYGIPICLTPTSEGKIKLKLKFTNKKISNGTGITSNYTYQIMDTQFENGAMPSTKKTGGVERVLKRETVTGKPSEYTTAIIELDKTTIFDNANGDYIYIKIEPSVDDQVVMVETVGDIIYQDNK